MTNLTPPIRAQAALGALIAALVALTGCSSSATTATTASMSGRTSASSSTTGSANPIGGSITVLAAASLTGSFTQLGKQFQAAHPGVRVTFSFGSSAELATQITNGAPADVFAAASPATMQTVVKANDAGNAVTFARNLLEIATPPDNPAKIGALADLSRPGVKLAVCQPQVPCGAAATAMLGKDKVTAHPVTLEKDVKSTLAKVVQGEVDAGVVYVTDVLAAGTTVHGVAIPPAQNVTTAYPIAALTNSKNPAPAEAFVSYVTSLAGLAVLRAAGFAQP